MDIERPLHLHVEALRQVDADLRARGIAMTLLLEVWWPTQEAFVYDPQRLAAMITDPQIGFEDLVAERDTVAKFFAILPDGRWAPSPAFFSITPTDPKAAC